LRRHHIDAGALFCVLDLLYWRYRQEKGPAVQSGACL